MKENLNEIKKKLTDASHLYWLTVDAQTAEKIDEKYNEFPGGAFTMSEDTFVKAFWDDIEDMDVLIDNEENFNHMANMPHLKNETLPKPPTRKKIIIDLALAIIGIAAVLIFDLILPLVPNSIFSAISFALRLPCSILCLVAFVLLIIRIVQYVKKFKQYKICLKRYNEAKNYNENIYPQKFKEWQVKEEEIRLGLIDKINDKLKQGDKARKELIEKRYMPRDENDFDSFLTYDQLYYARDLLEILNSKRADSLKEALEILEIKKEKIDRQLEEERLPQQDDYEDDFVIREPCKYFQSLSPDLQEVEIKKAIEETFEMHIQNQGLYECLTKYEGLYIKKALEEKNYDIKNMYMHLRKFIADRILDNSYLIINNKFKNKKLPEYRKSTRFKMGIVATCLCVLGAVALIPNLVIQFTLGNEHPAVIPLSAVTVVFVMVGGFLFGGKRLYCKVCGHKGRVIRVDESEKYQEISRERINPVIQDSVIAATRDAHISYDANGNAYKEKIVNKKHITKFYRCPHCGREWTDFEIKSVD